MTENMTIAEINGYQITEIPPGWDLRFAADNPSTGYGNKFHSLDAAKRWASTQTK